MRYDSPINDLYGVEPERGHKRPGVSGLLVLAALAGLFLYESVHPVMRLQSSPPPEFQKATATSSQEHMARSYWSLATASVSHKYSYGEMLPSNPPEDFMASSGEDTATRTLYWQRLRGVWNQEGVWVKSYELDTEWVSGVLGSFDKATEVIRSVFNF